MLRTWLWGPLSPLGLGIAALTALADQANKFWMLYVYDIGAKGSVALTSFFDSGAGVEPGHQLRAVAPGKRARPVGADPVRAGREFWR